MSSPTHSVPIPSGDPREPVHEIVARCLDRLNRGETIDPLEIVTEHPEAAEEVLDQLSAFVDLGVLLSSSGPMEAGVETDGGTDPEPSLDSKSSRGSMSTSGHGACANEGRREERLERGAGPSNERRQS